MIPKIGSIYIYNPCIKSKNRHPGWIHSDSQDMMLDGCKVKVMGNANGPYIFGEFVLDRYLKTLKGFEPRQYSFLIDQLCPIPSRFNYLAYDPVNKPGAAV